MICSTSFAVSIEERKKTSKGTPLSAAMGSFEGGGAGGTDLARRD